MTLCLTVASRRFNLNTLFKFWNVEKWELSLLHFFWSADWGLPTAIISDRDPRFIRSLWTEIFNILLVRLIYSTAYHPQPEKDLWISPMIARAQRDDGEESSYSPVVHGGTIATGNTIIENTATRDQLARELEAVCFETEAAGVLYDFQCLVIRGHTRNLGLL